MCQYRSDTARDLETRKSAGDFRFLTRCSLSLSLSLSLHRRDLYIQQRRCACSSDAASYYTCAANGSQRSSARALAAAASQWPTCKSLGQPASRLNLLRQIARSPMYIELARAERERERERERELRGPSLSRAANACSALAPAHAFKCIAFFFSSLCSLFPGAFKPLSAFFPLFLLSPRSGKVKRARGRRMRVSSLRM